MSKLVVMAAGLGLRFGGPKQLEPVGPSGETLMDYVLFDAWRSGFAEAILVIRREIAGACGIVANRHGHRIRICTVFQSIDRQTPRGTVAAVLSARNLIAEDFAALNADDFYGVEAYRLASAFLKGPPDDGDNHAVVTLPLSATLSVHGGVTRAICETVGDELTRLDEVHGLVRRGGAVLAGGRRFSGAEPVSMNFWTFRRSVVSELATVFDRFSAHHDGQDELPLPVAMDSLIEAGRARVRVLHAPGPWLGLTHATDVPMVRASLRDLTDRGDYPSPLWA